MLKFIVLGQVPGTSIQLNFDQILLIGAGFYGCILLIYEIRRWQKSDANRRTKSHAL